MSWKQSKITGVNPLRPKRQMTKYDEEMSSFLIKKRLAEAVWCLVKTHFSSLRPITYAKYHIISKWKHGKSGVQVFKWNRVPRLFFLNPLENEQMSLSQCYQIIERGHPLGHKGENRQCWLQDTFKCSNQHSGRHGWQETVLLLLF